jgi:hypothetical protein
MLAKTSTRKPFEMNINIIIFFLTRMNEPKRIFSIKYDRKINIKATWGG